MVVTYPNMMIDLPWNSPSEDQKRFRLILTYVFAATFLFSVIMPWLPVPEIERIKAEAIPPRLAKLILEKKELPKPASPPVIKKPKINKPKAEQPKPKKKVKVKPKLKKTVDTAALARKKAESSGLLAFKDQLADLRNTSISSSALTNRNLQKSGSSASKTSRSLITASASSASNGISTSRLSRDTGGNQLSGRSVTKVSSSIGGTSSGNIKRGRDSRKASRSTEEIQLVFDKNKGAIYSIYNRELRKNPTLQGKVVLELTIEASGQVTNCRIISSELESATLDRKLIARIKLFRFSSRAVETMVVTYPIEFLPS